MVRASLAASRTAAVLSRMRLRFLKPALMELGFTREDSGFYTER